MTKQASIDSSHDQETNRHALDSFLQSLNHLQDIDQGFPLQYAVCLIEIARDEGLSPTALAQRTNLALSTVSRIIAALSEHRPNGRSYQLISITTASGGRRRKTLHLTTAGHIAIQNILHCLLNRP
jgi:DNA-binding MarR family transcriptional regulator